MAKKKRVLRQILWIAVVIALALGFVRFVGQRTIVNGSSMEPTLQDGDSLYVDKLSYRFHAPRRFDIIVFPKPGQPDYYLIKRVIGLPGETVQVKDGCVYLNGKKLKESYGREAMQDPGRFEDPVKLGKDEYFVLGDNRNYSTDSRWIGPIQRDTIIGKATVRLWPNPKHL